MRKQAQEYAEAVTKEAIRGLVGLIDEAIDLRRAEPLRFALFHKRMVQLLSAAPYFVAFRKARISRHRRLEMRYTAKAYALSQTLARVCGLDSAHCPA